MAQSFVTVLIEAGLACLVDVVPRGDAHRSSTRRDAYCLKFYELGSAPSSLELVDEMT